MSIATNVSRIKGNITAALAAIADKGVNVPDGSTSDALASLIASIEAGGSGADDSLKGIIERTAVTLTLPNNLTRVGEYAFYNFTNLALTSLSAGVKSVGNYGFYGCKKLAITKLPDGFLTVMNYAFYGCTSITSMEFPQTLKNIAVHAFENCTGLTEVTFKAKPSGVFGSSAFKGCTNLLTINVPWEEGAVANAPWGATNATINYNYVAEEE